VILRSVLCCAVFAGNWITCPSDWESFFFLLPFRRFLQSFCERQPPPMVDLDGRRNRPAVVREVGSSVSFGRSTAEASSRLWCRRAGLPARRSGGAWTWAWIFFAGGARREVCDVMHSLHIHSIVLAPWQQLGCMCCRAFCVSKFEVRGTGTGREDNN
jgi:hypothetical protein